MITVACLFVRGHVRYDVDYVRKLASMVGRHLRAPHRVVCLTDQPEAMPAGVTPIPIQSMSGVKAWWNKLRLFDPAIGLRGRVLYLDLDTLIVDALEPIVSLPVPFALVPHSGGFTGKGGLVVVPRFNSSVMVFDAGSQAALWRDWTPDVAARLWGDQDWIGERAPEAFAMPLAWFPRISAVGDGPPFDHAAKVILAKTPKNEEAARRWGWVREAWA